MNVFKKISISNQKLPVRTREVTLVRQEYLILLNWYYDLHLPKSSQVFDMVIICFPKKKKYSSIPTTTMNNNKEKQIGFKCLCVYLFW